MKHDTTPKPIYLKAIQSEDWTAAGALSEFIDNSFGGIRGDASTVWIAHDRTRRMLTILDDGQGMEAVYKLFKLGDGAGRGIGDIGHFGSGGTMANIWLSRIAQVWTLRDGKVSSHKINWLKQIAADEYWAVPDVWEEPVDGKNVPTELYELGHGTMIQIHLLEGRSFYTQPLIAELAQAYAPGIRQGKQIIWQTIQRGKPPQSQRLAVDESAAHIEDVVDIDGAVEIDGVSLPIRGRVTLSDVPFSRSEIAIGYGYRVIIWTRDCYTSPDGKESFHGSGVSGWLDLGEGWQDGYFTTTKTNFKNAEVRKAVMAFIFERIRPLLEKTEKASQRMVFQELELSLAAALNSDSDARVNYPSAVHVDMEKPEKPEGDKDEIEMPDDESEPSDEGKEPPEGEPEDGDDDLPNPAMANIEVIQMSDHDMEGILCRIDVHGDFGVRALVNADHEQIKEALRAKPTNRQALILFVAHQIANVIADNEEMMKKTFKPRIVSMIENFKGRQREQFILRLILDRVKWPVMA